MPDTDPTTIEPAPGRMRARFNGGVLADSEHALVLREEGRPPRVYFPAKDVERGYLSPSRFATQDAQLGQASYWTVSYNGVVAEDAVWSYEHPLAGASQIAGHLAFDETKGFEIYEPDKGEMGVQL